MTRVFAVVLSLISPGAGHFLLGERVRGLIAAIVGGLLLLALPLAIRRGGGAGRAGAAVGVRAGAV